MSISEWNFSSKMQNKTLDCIVVIPEEDWIVSNFINGRWTFFKNLEVSEIYGYAEYNKSIDHILKEGKPFLFSESEVVSKITDIQNDAHAELLREFPNSSDLIPKPDKILVEVYRLKESKIIYPEWVEVS